MRQLYKIVVIGDGGVGKTTTIHNIYHYLSKKFQSVSYKSCEDDSDSKNIDRTRFMDFHTISFQFQDQRIVWQIWDVQGQRFPSSKAYTSINPLDHITEIIVKNAHLVILTYDSSNNSTYNELFRVGGFYDLIKPFALQNQSFLLLGSKTDLSKEDYMDPIAKLSIDHDFETISYNNTFLENISIVSEAILTKLHMNEEQSHPMTVTDEPVSLKIVR